MLTRSVSYALAAILIATGMVLAVTMGAPLLSMIAPVASVAAAVILLTLARLPDDASDAADDNAVPLSEPVRALHDHAGFAAFADGLDQPLLVIGAGRVRYANGPAQTLLGAFIVGADVRSAIRHPVAADRLVRADPPSDSINLVGLGRADQVWQMRTVPIDAGNTLVLLTDQSQRVAIDRMRADFVANASHELRTPLAAILGFVETLRDPDAGADAALRDRFLGIIDTEARRMQMLVDDLLSISRIEASKAMPPDQLAQLPIITRTVIADLGASGDPRAADIVMLPIAHDALPAVRGDPAQISQLLNNIIGNAMKYGRAGTPVRVTLAPTGKDWVRITVEDQGDGIAPEHLPRLTERFYRVDSARSRAIGGTGLGLAIVRHIVERHRGQLDIVSEIGRGTTVSVQLPVGHASL